MFIVLTYDNQSTPSWFSLFLNFMTNSPMDEKALSGSTELGLIVIKAGVSNTRAACGPRGHFLRPVMLFGNLQRIICVAKCVEKTCREIIESKLNDAQCGFHPGRSTTDRISLSSKILRNLGSMLKTSSQLCRPRESIRPGSLWKALGSVAWVRCWRPPVTGRQVTIFLLRNLCPFRES